MFFLQVKDHVSVLYKLPSTAVISYVPNFRYFDITRKEIRYQYEEQVKVEFIIIIIIIIIIITE